MPWKCYRISTHAKGEHMDVDTRFTHVRSGYTETICDRCREAILESEVRHIIETPNTLLIVCEECLKLIEN